MFKYSLLMLFYIDFKLNIDMYVKIVLNNYYWGEFLVRLSLNKFFRYEKKKYFFFLCLKKKKNNWRFSMDRFVGYGCLYDVWSFIFIYFLLYCYNKLICMDIDICVFIVEIYEIDVWYKNIIFIIIIWIVIFKNYMVLLKMYRVLYRLEFILSFENDWFL